MNKALFTPRLLRNPQANNTIINIETQFPIIVREVDVVPDGVSAAADYAGELGGFC